MVDAVWWDTESLLIFFENGELHLIGPIGGKSTHSHMKKSLPKSSRFSSVHNGAFFVLTSESKIDPKKEDWRATTLEISSIQLIQPFELYEQYIECSDFDAALKLAKQHGFDVDLIWKKTWIDSALNQNAFEILDKIQDTVWVLRECKERLPQTADEAKLLLDYGFRRSTPSVFAGSNVDQTLLSQAAEAFENVQERELLFFKVLFHHFLRRLDLYRHIKGTF